jgi:peptide/nickel transport system ATP-binding protein
MSDAVATPPVLEVRDLSVRYRRRGGVPWRPEYFDALGSVDFTLRRGESLAIVGESGSGKSTLARALFRLVVPVTGQVLVEGVDLAILSPAELRERRRRMQMVFQDPLSSLDPAFRVFDVVAEPLAVAEPGLSHAGLAARVEAQLAEVGLGREYLARRPGQLSGGQAQRVAIARALVADPSVLVCDEPVSALDAPLRAQILDLLDAQRRRRHLSLLFVTHDLAAARYLCARTLVLRRGRVVEQGETGRLFAAPREDYTRELLASMLCLPD